MSINLILASNDLVKQTEVGLLTPDFLTYLRKLSDKKLQLICNLSTYEKTYFNRKQLTILRKEIDILKSKNLISDFDKDLAGLENATNIALKNKNCFLILIGD